ncbi:MAG TPA: hypothetical protein VGE50_00665 [Gammaproteobacteria bacterium]
MRFLAEFVMRGRLQAVVVTAVTALMALLLLPLAYLSGAAVGLVTLRIGPVQGLSVIAGAMLVVALSSGLLFGNPLPGIGFALVLWMPVWVLATNLRRSANLAQSVKLAALFGAMLVFGIYLATDNPVSWWRSSLLEILSPALEGAAKESIDEMSSAVAQIARLMTGLMGGLMGLTLLGCLFIARWWQAILYNPGGFQGEFHQLRLGKRFAVITLVVGLLLMSGGGAIQMVTDLLVVMVMLYMIQGIAVSHALVAKAGANAAWLVVLYLLLVFALPQTALTLAVAGFVDNWIDFRTIFGAKPKQ